MLYETLAAEARKNDSLDEVRLAALDRVRWLPDVLERQREAHARALRFDCTRASDLRASATRAAVDEQLAACGDEDGRAAVLCLMLAARSDAVALWHHGDEIRPLLRRVRGWTAPEAAVLLARVAEYDTGWWFADGLTFALDAAEQLGTEERRAIAPWVRQAYVALRDRSMEAPVRSRLSRRLSSLLASADEADLPAALLPARAPWAAALRERAEKEPTAELAALLRHFTALSGPRPSQKWRGTCQELMAAADAADAVAATLRDLAEGETVCSRGHGPHTAWLPDDYHHHYVAHQNDGDLVRGLVWAAALSDGPAAVRHLGTLALRVSGAERGILEDLKLAGAALNALSETGDPASLDALWRLRTRIRHRALRKQLDTALTTAAGQQGITPQQLVERTVPDHGLGQDGLRAWELGDHQVRVTIEDATTVRLTYVRPDGTTSRTAPAAVKKQHAEGLKQAKAFAKELRGTLASERARVEALLSTEREWPYDEWRRHYRDHPVTGVLTRALIWEFRTADGPWRPAAPGSAAPAEASRVRLWHPARSCADEVRGWREHLMAERLRQPFKQAFREIYLLTPAEEETRTYSNRFAAHIVRYQQLYALFKERGWQARYLGRHEGGYDGAARGEFADGTWRAVLHHEPADEDFDHSPAHAATDQVRFERRTGRQWREAPLTEVPPLVFSEAMRDADLFIGVTSIAADPEWTDRGEHRHTAYWRTTAFGTLTAGAEIRRAALERIVPRLKIADRCALEGRFLVVRGELATYRIHLGSANVLMAPDDRYLCIVPAGRAPSGGGRVFLPFEDDRLSLILSKALLLAADTKITDGTILRQIRGEG
ncbi:DUF4132 domain-containing protein [Streptomyces indicus]|uniref:Uncharacterized protein n=1 Tax=Streptomyces indicus TaxID=417292 RepID=A0A1G8UR26_9ACTN|nr:DUF4132 domain-containing protein [Streptomyces indicus]SDJ55957.1 protein of unknown function [Streptomyces indicus]